MWRTFLSSTAYQQNHVYAEGKADTQPNQSPFARVDVDFRGADLTGVLVWKTRVGRQKGQGGQGMGVAVRTGCRYICFAPAKVTPCASNK